MSVISKNVFVFVEIKLSLNFLFYNAFVVLFFPSSRCMLNSENFGFDPIQLVTFVPSTSSVSLK